MPYVKRGHGLAGLKLLLQNRGEHPIVVDVAGCEIRQPADGYPLPPRATFPIRLTLSSLCRFVNTLEPFVGMWWW